MKVGRSVGRWQFHRYPTAAAAKRRRDSPHEAKDEWTNERTNDLLPTPTSQCLGCIQCVCGMAAPPPPPIIITTQQQQWRWRGRRTSGIESNTHHHQQQPRVTPIRSLGVLPAETEGFIVVRRFSVCIYLLTSPHPPTRKTRRMLTDTVFVLCWMHSKAYSGRKVKRPRGRGGEM